jgi:hypothetical protein
MAQATAHPDRRLISSKDVQGTNVYGAPHNNGSKLTAFSPGQKVMQTATEGQVQEITYWWPRPGSIKPLKKHTFYTKVGDQICGVGYWEGSQTAASAERSKSSYR